MQSPAFWPRHAFAFKGGGGSAPAQAIASAPVPLPAPPVTRTSADVLQAESEVAKENLLKKSIKKTIFAGDTGGYQPPSLRPDQGKFQKFP